MFRCCRFPYIKLSFNWGTKPKGLISQKGTADAGGIAWASIRVAWIGLDGADKPARPLFSIRRTGSKVGPKNSTIGGDLGPADGNSILSGKGRCGEPGWVAGTFTFVPLR